MKNIKILLGVFCAVFCAGLVASASDAPPTALQLIKQGDRYVGDQSRDKVLTVYSDKSFGGVTPTIWYVDYYDPDAKFKIVEVQFGADLKLGVKRPWKLFGGKGDLGNLLDLDEIKIDSDNALHIAISQQVFKPLTFKASQMWLEREAGEPVWKVRLWCAQLDNPEATVEVGDVYVSAKDGKVVRADLHLEFLNQQH